MTLLASGTKTLFGAYVPMDAYLDPKSKLGQVTSTGWPGKVASCCHQQWGWHHDRVSWASAAPSSKGVAPTGTTAARYCPLPGPLVPGHEQGLSTRNI